MSDIQEYIIPKHIDEAEMLLIGLGEEFDDVRTFRGEEAYGRGRELLEASGQSALLPMWQSLYREEQSDSAVKNGLCGLAKRLEGKNYFVVSVSVNRVIEEVPWREGRLVMPCGYERRLQCSRSCERNLKMAGGTEYETVRARMLSWRQSLRQGEETGLPDGFGRCPVCGEALVPNNVYADAYDENGYLPDWQNYMKWLQGTLNRRLMVLELGVGMKFPTVIRFPFEKVAYFNQKAEFYRINENLYQITEELAAKGVGIAKNAIDWLQSLC